MKRTNVLALFAVALVLGAAGCFTQREDPKEDRTILKAGQQVSADMVGWVAVPNTVPDVKSGAIAYAVLAAQNVVPAKMNGWVAVNPAFFAKMTDIKVETPPAVTAERWVLKPEGKSVPKDKNGWVALPYSAPTIEKSAHKQDREMATLATNNIVPKEMHGWVAVEADALAKIVDKYLRTGPGSKVSKE
jgi:hypothetical protein